MKNRAIRKLLVVVLFIYATISQHCFAQDGLVAHWDFEDIGSFRTTDIIGGLSAYLLGAELVTEPAPHGGSYALTCDSGSPDGRGSSNITFKINNDSFSISAWVKTTGTVGNRIITVSPSGGTGQGYWLDITNGGLFGIQIGTATPLQVSGNTGISLEDGEYHYLVGVHDAVNKELRVYVDGDLTGSSSTAGLSGAVGYDFSFGGTSNSRIFRGYIDEVKIFNRALVDAEIRQEFDPSLPNNPITLQDALDNSVFLWNTSGDKDWFGQNASTYDQIDAAQSGDITDQKVSSLVTTVSGPGNVSFHWKVSSEEKYDFLKFYIDEVEQTGISGEVDWEQRSFYLSSGQHQLKWSYSKDCCDSSGSDAGFLDNVVYSTGTQTPPVNLSGSIKAPDGSNICAMVLASGKFMFSCNPPGEFSLTDLPREKTGTVKRQVYADGFFPKVDILDGSTDDTVVMTPSGTCPSYNAIYDPAFVPASAGKRINIVGKVLLQDTQTPICAMVLANGQHTFSCGGTGSYALNIPLDKNGQFKLQVYADSFAPTIQTFDEFKTTNNVRMARATECEDTCPPQINPKKNLVLIAHGWNSNKDVWAEGMADLIRSEINNTEWNVCAYDWREEAEPQPLIARLNAVDVGEDLGFELFLRQYDNIHFIAHSAGSMLIETAAWKIRMLDDSPPTIHSTFFDAFAPEGESSKYGESSDWAEQYFDARPVFDFLCEGCTNVVLPHAFNFDVTGLDDKADPHDPHSWPYEWYVQKIGAFYHSVGTGFDLSLERGKVSSLPNHEPGARGELYYPRGGLCDISTVPEQRLEFCGEFSQ